MQIDYNERMLNYYPEIIKGIQEFQALIGSQSVQIEELHEKLVSVLDNAHITTADEQQIQAWEKFLNIIPCDLGLLDYDEWLVRRRGAIATKLFINQKLNTKSIEDIVRVLRGGWAKSYVKDGLLHVSVTPAKGDLSESFHDIEDAIGEKIPLHLNYEVIRELYTWLSLGKWDKTWGDVKNSHENWLDVLYDSEHYKESEGTLK